MVWGLRFQALEPDFRSKPLNIVYDEGISRILKTIHLLLKINETLNKLLSTQSSFVC